MFTDARAAAPLLVAAGTLAGTLGAALPLAAGLPGSAAALLAALVAAGTTGVALTRLRPARDPAEPVCADVRLDGFETAPSALLLVGPDGRISHANAAFHALLDHHGPQLRRRLDLPAADRLIGTDIRLLLPDYDAHRSGPWQGRLALGDHSLGLRLAPLVDGKGSVLALADLTAHQRLQAQMGALERHQPLLELSHDGRILRASDLAARTAGMEPAALLGRSLDTLVADAGTTVANALSQAVENGVARTRLALSTRAGTVWLDATLHALRDDDGRLDRLLLLASDATDSVNGLQREEAQRRESQETLATMARHLGDGLTALAQGDLTHRITHAFPPPYEPLRQNFNSALDRLAKALVEVLSVTGTISNRAAELNAAAEDLSRRTEGQAATLEETAAALDELTASVRSAAENAASADQSARAAHREAEESGRVVTDAVNAMGQIESSSRQISQIIGVIDEIAFQTNLLALNAGVEAARAGDAGRGFAVVASEVRALAQRSSEAAREIKDLISASSRQVENGVTLVGQAGDTLRAIVAGVNNIAKQVSALAQSSREQATGITEINSGVTMLDQVTQQNAAMVEESTAASHSLRRAAESLAALMHRFQLDGVVPTQVEAAVPPPPENNVTHLRLAEATPTREPRRPARAAAQAGWEEF